MDVHIYVAIVLNYYCDFDRWTSARLLCKESKALVDNLETIYDHGGARTMIRVDMCMCCNRISDVEWIPFPCDNPRISGTNRRYIVCCKRWQCRVSALCSMLSDCEQNNIFLLRRPLMFGENINIPRSDGSVTEGGEYNPNYVVKRDGKCFLNVFWLMDDDVYHKIVPLSYYSQMKPPIIERRSLFTNVVSGPI